MGVILTFAYGPLVVNTGSFDDRLAFDRRTKSSLSLGSFLEYEGARRYLVPSGQDGGICACILMC